MRPISQRSSLRKITMRQKAHSTAEFGGSQDDGARKPGGMAFPRPPLFRIDSND